MTYGLSGMTLIGSAVVASVVALSRPPQGGGAASGQELAGIRCDAMEGDRVHIHQHLVIFDHGKQVPIPDNVGRPLMKQCLYWVHTHTKDGVIHIESPTTRTFTLADFFTIWGQTLSTTTAASAKADKGTKLKVWVDGNPYKGDPRVIPLNPHTDVVIEAGPPFPTPPKFTAWGDR